MEQQEWMPVKGYEGKYEINKNSEIRSLNKNHYKKIISTRIDRAGYHTVRLSKEGKPKSHLVHRLLAIAFIENPENKPQINHKDANKLNNHISNLEWCTQSENMRHAFAMNLIPRKRIPVMDMCTGQIFRDSREAATYYAINHYTMRGYLSGQIKHNPTCAEYMRGSA